MITNYILKGKKPVAEPDILKWGARFASSSQNVAKTTVGEYLVSTVFLGIDHNWSPSGKPILFETMVFVSPKSKRKRNKFSDIQYRYRTWDEAECGHRRVIRLVKAVQAI